MRITSFIGLRFLRPVSVSFVCRGYRAHPTQMTFTHSLMSRAFTQVAEAALQTPLFMLSLLILFSIIVFFPKQSTLWLSKGPEHRLGRLLNGNGIKLSILRCSFLRQLVRFWTGSLAFIRFLPPSLPQVYSIDRFVELLTHVIFRRLQYALVLIS